MTRAKPLDDVAKIINYLYTAPNEERSLNDVVYSCRIPYSTVRKIMKFDFPHCFEEKEFLGWWWTGESPVRGMPFEPTVHIPQDHVSGSVNVTGASLQGARVSKWVWNQDALRFLDRLFKDTGGMSFEEVLLKAQKEGQLQMFNIIGKTLSRAADQMSKTGKVPFK